MEGNPMNNPLCPDPQYSEYDPAQQNCYNLEAVSILKPDAPPTRDHSATPDLLFGGAIVLALAAMFLKKRQ